MPHKPRSTMMEHFVKSSTSWLKFQTFRLTKNMRAHEDQEDFAQLLNGETISNEEVIPSNSTCIAIPDRCHLANDIANDIVGRCFW